MSVAKAILFVAAVLVPGVALVATYADGTVTRARLERFARRQRLSISVGNGNHVIRYLATTRRWRQAGFAGGVILSQFAAPPRSIIYFNAIVIFVGWFVGALIAEVHVAQLEYGPVRLASLQPRRPDQYLGRLAWMLVPVAAAVSLLTGAGTAVADANGWAQPNRARVIALVAAALVLAVLIRAIQHRVLRRPQPLAAPDIVEADDAIRSRALHVLAGGGTALVLFLVNNQLGEIHPTTSTYADAIRSLQGVATYVIAVVGWLVATSTWLPPGATRRASGPAAGTA
jgi:hypothetical protein